MKDKFTIYFFSIFIAVFVILFSYFKFFKSNKETNCSESIGLYFKSKNNNNSVKTTLLYKNTYHIEYYDSLKNIKVVYTVITDDSCRIVDKKVNEVY